VSNNSSSDYILLSFGKYYANPKLPLERGIIVTFTKGAHPYKNQLTTA